MGEEEFRKESAKNLDLFSDSIFLVEKLLFENNLGMKFKKKLLKMHLSNLKLTYGFIKKASLCFKREQHENEIKKFDFIRKGIFLNQSPLCLNCMSRDLQDEYIEFVSCGHGFHKKCLKINKNELKNISCSKC
jgi:hypothetical protein